MARKILIADDSKINRQMLNAYLCRDYDILEAENGADALNVLYRSYKSLSAVLLDIVMPVKDGYDVLKEMRDNVALSQIPVIMITASGEEEARVRALSLGANDFVTKPYNPDIIRHCLRNNIALRETASIVNAIQKDKLTGIYNREFFFEKASEMIKGKEPGHYVLACFDVDNFKLVNDQFGAAEGDRILRYIGGALSRLFSSVNGVCGRISGDNFASLFPNTPEITERVTQSHATALLPKDTPANLSFSVGRYVVNDRSLPVSAIYDRAYIAKQSVKGRYDVHVAYFSDSMLESLVREQRITSEMDAALAARQFEVWFQPQYNHATGARIGAEALVRWRHPKNGLVQPGMFIPVFEQNGFIYMLDRYVWEEVCAALRRWIDEGRSPLHVSVNVSRYDIFRPDFFSVITGLVEKYAVPVELLRLEITESAFAKSTEQIVRVVKRLIDYGFTVEIDDFGSGYSSLNTLKSVPAQVVKLDMRFLEDDDDAKRGGSILESVVRMAKWLGMTVIAEGVEDLEQADFLKSIGCSNVQGYLYARPMPMSEYETLCRSLGKERPSMELATAPHLDSNTFWDPKSMDTLIFNTYVGGACIFEYHNERIEIVRVNDKYAKVIGGEGCTSEYALNMVWEDHMDAEAARLTRDAIRRAIETGDDAIYEASYFGLPGSAGKTYLRTTFRLIAQTKDRFLLYSTNENITLQREAELKEREAERKRLDAAEQLRTILSTVSGGISATTSEDEKLIYIFANDAYYAMFGYTREQFHAELPHGLPDLIHPDDLPAVSAAVEETAKTGKRTQIEFRARKRDGSEIWVRSSGSICRLGSVQTPVHIAVSIDITQQRANEHAFRLANEQIRTLMDGTPGGFCRMQILPTHTARVVYCNDGFCRLLSQRREDLEALYGEDALRGVHPDDVERVLSAYRRIVAGSGQLQERYRLRNGAGAYIWVTVNGRMATAENGERYINAYFTDVTEDVLLEMRRAELLENLPCGAGIYEIDNSGIRATYLNKRYRAYLGREIGELGTAPVFEVVHPDDRQRLKDSLKIALAEGRDGRCDVRIMDGKGGYIPFRIVGTMMSRSEGKSTVYVTYTPLADGEPVSRFTLSMVLDAMSGASSDMFFIKDSELRYLYGSRAFTRMTGCGDAADIIGKNDCDLFDPTLAAAYVSDDKALLASGEPLVNRLENLPSADGSLRYSSTSKFLIRDAAGNAAGILGIGRDVTDERSTVSQLRLLIDSIPGGLATYEYSISGLRLIYFNEGYCRLFGCTRAEYYEKSRKNPLVYVDPADRPMVLAQIDALHSGQTSIDCLYRAQPYTGARKWINLKASVSDRRGDTMVINAALFDVTERQESMERLRISEEENRLAIEHSGRIISRYSVSERSVCLPPDVAKAFSLPERITDVPDGPVRDGLIAAESRGAYIALYESIRRGQKSGSAVYKERWQDGWRWMEARYTTIFSDTGEPVSAVISFAEVTDALEKDAVFQKWHQSLQAKKPESFSLYRCNVNHVTALDAMEGSLLNLRFQPGSFHFDERTAEYVSQYVYAEDAERFSSFLCVDALLAAYARGTCADQIEYREKMPDGSLRWLRLTVDLLTYPGSTNVEAYLMFESIDDSKRAELLTLERAETDPLTGVLNRTAFAAKVDRIIRTSEPNVRHALLMLDLDGFKMVNDVFGHAAGDQALIDISGALRAVLRKGDLLGRLGGDEFVLFIYDLPDDGVAIHKAKQICLSTRKAFSLEVQVSGSVGVSICPRDGRSFESLYKKADEALYHVKGSGKGSYAIYRPDMRDEHLVPEPDAAAAVGKKKEKKRRMLIVDDNTIDYELLANIFKDDFIVDKARDGNSALIRMRHYGSAISVVLLDLLMPGMDGFAVLEKMQLSAELRSIPVVVVSAADDRTASLRAIQCGASDFVTKPVDPDILRIRVQSAVSKAENERLRAQNSVLALQSAEILRYKTALERSKIAVVECDWTTGAFTYAPSVSSQIAGIYDGRKLWHILLSDIVADTETVQTMQEFVHALAEDRTRTDDEIIVRLRTPSNDRRLFRMSVHKLTDAFHLTDKLLLTFSEAEP